jgi:hypothetical protein
MEARGGIVHVTLRLREVFAATTNSAPALIIGRFQRSRLRIVVSQIGRNSRQN